MKRLLLAGAITVAAHALLLSSGSGWFSGRAYVPPKKAPITLSLNIVQQPAKSPVQAGSVTAKEMKGRALPATRIETLPPAKPKPLPKPRLKPEPKPRPKPKPHPKNKPRHETAAQTKPASLKAKVKPVPSHRTPISTEKHEVRKPQQAVDTGPAREKEVSRIPPASGFKEPVSAEMVQDALSDYPDQGSEAPKQGLAAAGTELGQPGPSGPAVQLAIPLYLKNPRPEYPELARRRRFQGTVLLEVLVKKDGRPGDVKISRSSGHPSLDRAALAAVKKWVFKPGSKNGKAMEMRVKIPIRFQLD